MPETLKLRITDGKDLSVASALMQDCVVAAVDMAFDATARRFALIGNRYRHEAAPGLFSRLVGAKGERVRTGLHLNDVTAATTKNIALGDPDAVGALLAIDAQAIDEAFEIVLTFAGGSSVRLKADCIDGIMSDLSEPWPAGARPNHD
ncbi:DUF2948 family protein [Gimibacter soli]|uniref:DUF2948 family protein n=1 Tax=Gimibacter soli TaxID=3024400 RepID=A0AAE9XU00_9PROT|nr:DUF2948 family protein [Gimibacter soli]WCL54861.1 DUF2948 family protein [Gimibacter soli]